MYIVTRLTKFDSELKIIGIATDVKFAHKLIADHMQYRGKALHRRHSETKPAIAIEGFKAYLKTPLANKITVEYTITPGDSNKLLSISKF